MYTVPPVVTVACGALTWLIGAFLVKNIKFLNRYNLPAPVVGGIVVALVFTLLHAEHWDVIKFNSQLVPPMMLAFFTSLGYGASVTELKRGGKAVFVFFVACTILLVIQAALGAIIAVTMGEPALFGVLTSNVALAGGPGTALSFAGVFEEAGVKGAAASGLSAAMLGIVLGGFLGGPISTMLIRKHGLEPAERRPRTDAVHPEDSPISSDNLAYDLLYHGALILIMGSVGYYLSKAIEAEGIKLPFYIGGMIVAALVRNVEDRYRLFHIRQDFIDAIGTTFLTLFIAVSMMSLELWNVAAVAGPLLVILVLQAVLICIVAATIMFKVCGEDYDAAVISGGMIGFMLGTTANALATMRAVSERFGPAPRAFLVVPLVGACFVDFVNALVTSVSLNLLH